MKKLFALVIALMMLCCAAFAETEIEGVEELYDGTWINFEDDGFRIYIPSDWLVLEVTEDMLAGGIYYAAASPDGAMTAQVAWAELDALTDIATLQTELAAAYPGAEAMTIGNVETVCFADAEADILGFALPDLIDPGMYMFMFTPASSEEAVELATMMMTSICLIEEAAA